MAICYMCVCEFSSSWYYLARWVLLCGALHASSVLTITAVCVFFCSIASADLMAINASVFE